MTSDSVVILKPNHAVCSKVLQRYIYCMKCFMHRWIPWCGPSNPLPVSLICSGISTPKPLLILWICLNVAFPSVSLPGVTGLSPLTPYCCHVIKAVVLHWWFWCVCMQLPFSFTWQSLKDKFKEIGKNVPHWNTVVMRARLTTVEVYSLIYCGTFSVPCVFYIHWMDIWSGNYIQCE